MSETNRGLFQTTKQVVRPLLPSFVVEALRRWRNPSASYQVLDAAPTMDASAVGWSHPTVAERQHAAFAPLLSDLKQGNPRRDFVALAEAIKATALQNPEILELGCGSGWNLLVLQSLISRPFRYTGLDCSDAMIAI